MPHDRRAGGKFLNFFASEGTSYDRRIDSQRRAAGSALTTRHVVEAPPAARRIGPIACIVLVIGLGIVNRLPAQEPAQPEEPRLRQIVELLASPEYEGRSGAGGEKAAAYLTEQFRALKLEPLFNGDYGQPIPGKEAGTVGGRNVGARKLGSDPALRDQWVIVSAHFDHLGVRRGKTYPARTTTRPESR